MADLWNWQPNLAGSMGCGQYDRNKYNIVGSYGLQLPHGPGGKGYNLEACMQMCLDISPQYRFSGVQTATGACSCGTHFQPATDTPVCTSEDLMFPGYEVGRKYFHKRVVPVGECPLLWLCMMW